MAPSRRRTLAAALTLAGLFVLASTASAAPTVTLSATALPIPKNLLDPHSRTWPHTGQAGEGAELRASFTIHGTEDAGLAAPLRHVVVSLPNGTKVHTGGFTSCYPLGDWYHTGDAPVCPQRSLAGAVTEEMDMASIGGSDVSYPVRQGAFFYTGHGLGFWQLGVGGWLSMGGVAGGSLNSQELTENIPRVQVMDTGPDLSPEGATIAIGAAYRRGHSLISLLTLPKRCPAGGYPITARLSFGDGAAPTWQTVTVTAREPCRK